ncbi:uncharacterized protein LOC134282205, partial [Saccostrea cucullata]|uniref:uncharacterized protein LOC134282205 n=1 Tax=Saccostrea cuccullata TaxID=36930 RepID=UPI002ED2355F
MDRFQKQSRKIKRHIADIQNFEYRSEQPSNRSVKFLSILKNSRIHKIKDTPKLKRHIMLSLKEETFMKDVIRLLSEIQTKESGKRQLDRVWISDVMEIKMFLTNIEGEKLRHITDMVYTFGTVGYHAVTSTCDLIYVDADGNMIKLSKNYRKNTLIKNTESRKPSCLYISRLTGDLLVGIWDIGKAGIVNRYNSTGKHIQTIQNKLCSQPVYITENRNGDIIVSDWDRKAVVVTERGGKHRFSYTGRSSSSLPSGIMPCGICTDVFSLILVCDANTRTIHVLDKDGNQLSQIWTKQQVKYFPHSLSYDEKTHRLWIGFSNNR